MKRDEIVNEIRNKLREIVPQAISILYGSEARGDARIDSDIDILILIPDKFIRRFNSLKSLILDELFLIEIKNDVLISPLILLQHMWDERATPFTYNVLKDGIQL